MPEITARNWNAATGIALLALAGICAAGMLRAGLTIPNRLPLDPNEGWNAYHAVAAMAGHGLYPPPQDFMVNNYPPLSFYLVGALGNLMGDMIIAGRLVSFACLGLVAAAIAVAARRMGCSGLQAAFAAFLFVDVLLLYSDYAGMDDPQLLGHVLDIAGLIFVLSWPEKIWAILAGAMLMALAIFVKHNLVALPLTLALWLFLCERRSAIIFVLCGAGFAIAGLCAFRMAYGVDLWREISSARAYGLANLETSLRAWFSWAFLPATVASWLFLRYRGDRHVQLCSLYALVAFVIGAIFSGGDGVDANAMFDADIALVLCCALALNRFALPPKRTAIAALCALSLCSGLYQARDEDALHADYWLHPLREETALARSDIAFLKAQRGSAFCEMLSLCYWAGKRAQVDVYNIAEQFRAGARNDAELVRDIRAHAFGVMQFDSLEPFALSPRVEKILVTAYRLRRSDDNGVFFTPRRP